MLRVRLQLEQLDERVVPDGTYLDPAQRDPFLPPQIPGPVAPPSLPPIGVPGVPDLLPPLVPPTTSPVP